MAKKRWIQKAVGKNKGALTRKAKAKGMTVSQYCTGPGKQGSTRTKRQCNLAKTLKKMRKK
jgi:hypothetical protein